VAANRRVGKAHGPAADATTDTDDGLSCRLASQGIYQVNWLIPTWRRLVRGLSYVSLGIARSVLRRAVENIYPGEPSSWYTGEDRCHSCFLGGCVRREDNTLAVR
jgi:hypothetical protein